MDDRGNRHNVMCDPIPEALADSVWLGGEAMVAPYAQLTAAVPASEDGFADPDWQVL